jgi:hypothetical protein
MSLKNPSQEMSVHRVRTNNPIDRCQNISARCACLPQLRPLLHLCDVIEDDIFAKRRIWNAIGITKNHCKKLITKEIQRGNFEIIFLIF